MRVAEGGEFSLSELIAPRIEAEIALVIETEISTKGLSKEQLAAKVAYAVPALEIVDSRLRDWRIGIVDTIADNGAAARFVLGPGQHSLKNADLAACRMEMLTNGEVVSTGQGAASMGDPLNALAWLADTLIDHGSPLQPGYIVLTGALGPVVKMRSGDRIQARFDQLSPVSVNVR
jgi:2-keto-4-pentenoate hydratase